MLHRLPVSVAVALLLVFSGCTRSALTSDGVAPEAYVADPGSVGFDIKQLRAENGALRFEATYRAGGKLAKFLIEFGAARAVESKDFPITSGNGMFIAEEGSDATVLLGDLQKALEANAVPAKVRRARTLPFTFADIGDHLSQAPEGGFNAKPAGNWSAIKIFIGEGEREGEVFLNINMAIGKGQFSIKDADYGDRVLRELAKVL